MSDGTVERNGIAARPGKLSDARYVNSRICGMFKASGVLCGKDAQFRVIPPTVSTSLYACGVHLGLAVRWAEDRGSVRIPGVRSINQSDM